MKKFLKKKLFKLIKDSQRIKDIGITDEEKERRKLVRLGKIGRAGRARVIRDESGNII